MSADVLVSVSVLALLIVVTELTRGLLRRLRAGSSVSACAAELVSTFQMCCCAHELKLLSERGGVPPRLALSLTYLASVAHGLTFRGAAGNPTGVLERAYRSELSRGRALQRIACQFAGAACARAAVRQLWAAGLSGVHARHKLLGFRCGSPVHGSVPEAVAVELACAFVVQTVITHTHAMEEKYRVHAVAAAITTVVYAGGSVTGAVFNPAVAFSTQFSCDGNSFLEYCLIYWLSPVLGMMVSVLLSDKLTSVLRRSSSPQHLPPVMKKTT